MSCGQNPEKPVPARVALPSAKADAPVAGREPETTPVAAGEAEDRFWFSVGSDTILVLKVADREHPLPEGFPSGDAFRKALFREPDAPLVLLHLVVPHDLHPVDLFRRDGSAQQKLSDPAMIYRMPRSPRYCFAMVRADRPGVLSATTPDGRSGGIDLSRWTAELARQRLWRDPASGFVSYERIPGSFYGKMGP